MKLVEPFGNIKLDYIANNTLVFIHIDYTVPWSKSVCKDSLVWLHYQLKPWAEGQDLGICAAGLNRKMEKYLTLMGFHETDDTVIVGGQWACLWRL